MALAPVVLLVVLFSYDILFFSYKIDVTILENDTARDCNTHRHEWRGGNQRSSVPKDNFSGFCGAIKTDVGHYKLPDDKYPFNVHQSRRFLHDQLQPGCRFKLFVFGYGPEFKLGDAPSYPIRQTISRVLEDYGCDQPKVLKR